MNEETETNSRKNWENKKSSVRKNGEGNQNRKPKFNKAHRNDWKRNVNY